MKVVIFACVLTAAAYSASGAPMPENNDGIDDQEHVVFVPHQPQFRGRRHFGQPAFHSPCGAQIPIAPAPAYIAPVHHGYGGGGYGGGGYGGGGYGGGYGGGHGSYGYAPHYRTDDMETDILSDMDQGMSEHMPMARYSYGAAPVLSGYGQVAAGPAISVFPNANLRGCNVPLLLSCSPSIVSGHMVKSYGGYGAAAPVSVVSPAYRTIEDQNLEHEENAPEQAQESHLEPAEDSAHTNTH